MRMRPFLHGILALVVLAVGAAGLIAFTKHKAPLARKKPVKVLPRVQAVVSKPAPFTVVVRGEGTVEPAQQGSLSCESAGRVIFVSPALVDGGTFRKGQVLVRVDPSDYHLAVTLKKARVLEAETRLKTMQEEAAASLEEWRRVGRRQGKPPALVAKKPQLAEARAKVAAARAELQLARLNLKRTEVVAPYDGRVVRKLVDLGQYLRKGDKVAEIFAVNMAEITINLEDRDLAWLRVPGLTAPADEEGSPATVEVRFAGHELRWQGRVVRAGGKVDPRTRLVPVVVQVKAPYRQLPPLVPGVFVQVRLTGRRLPQADLLPRAAVREGDMVWVVDDQGVLRFRKVQVARFQDGQAVITDGLSAGERVVISPLRAVSDGMKVKVSLVGGEGAS